MVTLISKYIHVYLSLNITSFNHTKSNIICVKIFVFEYGITTKDYLQWTVFSPPGVHGTTVTSHVVEGYSGEIGPVTDHSMVALIVKATTMTPKSVIP